MYCIYFLLQEPARDLRQLLHSQSFKNNWIKKFRRLRPGPGFDSARSAANGQNRQLFLTIHPPLPPPSHTTHTHYSLSLYQASKLSPLLGIYHYIMQPSKFCSFSKTFLVYFLQMHRPASVLLYTAMRQIASSKVVYELN